MDKLEQFLGHLDGVRQSGKGWSARCPSHDDRQASLSVGEGDHGNVLVFCHAGCGLDSVLSALHLSKDAVSGVPRVVAEYPYTRDGVVRYTARRWAPKRFDIVPGLPPVAERVLFAEEWIAHARAKGKPVYLVEGEKDALALHAKGVPATTCVAGARSWQEHYADELQGLHVVIVADADEAGLAFAQAAHASLEPVVASLALRKAKYGKDISDHLDAGWGLEDLEPVAATHQGLTVYLGSDLHPEPVRWAWTGWLALGALSLLEGDPGDGKSVLSLHLAATWTTGQAMPDGTVNPLPPCHVILVSAEDDLRMTISPRLRAAGADMTRIHCVAAGAREDLPFSLAADLAALEELIKATQARVVVLDPLMAFLGENTDSSNDASVRRALGPLSMMARRHGVAFLVVRHLNKGSGKAIYRGGGSIGFVGAARAALLVAPHPDEDDKRVLIRSKNNLGPKDGGLVYALAMDPQYSVVKVSWVGEIDAAAQEMVDGPTDGSSRKDITDFLVHIFTPGPMRWDDAKPLLLAEGIVIKTAERYRKRVLTKTFGAHGNSSVTWSLKDPSPPLLTGTPPTSHPTSHIEQGSDQSLPPFSPFLTNGGGEGPDPDVAEYERDRALEAKPKVCEECGGTPAMAWSKPHWKVLCRAHAPVRTLFAL